MTKEAAELPIRTYRQIALEKIENICFRDNALFRGDDHSVHDILLQQAIQGVNMSFGTALIPSWKTANLRCKYNWSLSLLDISLF